MELGSIERTMHIDAPTDVVFEVLSDPDHLRQWWPDVVESGNPTGGIERIGFTRAAGGIIWEQFTAIEVVPPHKFSFRWAHPAGEKATPGNSFLVVFELEPAGAGTLLRMTESGFRERGWSEAEVSAQHGHHLAGWDLFLPRMPEYAVQVALGR